MNFPRLFGFGMYCNKGPGGAVENQWVCRSRGALIEGGLPHLQPGPIRLTRRTRG